MSFKIKQDAKVMITALIAGGTLSTAVVNPSTVEATQDSTMDYDSIVKDDMTLDYEYLPIDKEVRDVDVVISRNSSHDEPLEELGLTLFSNDTTAINDYKENNPLEIDIDDNILLNITGKVVHKNKIYYRVELSQTDASYLIDDYLEIKDYFNAEGQEGLDLNYDLAEDETTVVYEDEGYIILENESDEDIEGEDRENNNFVFYIDGNSVKKEMDMDSISKDVYAMKKTPIISMDDAMAPVAFVDEADKLNVVGENNNWYFVRLEDHVYNDDIYYDDEDVINVDNMYGFVDKRHFSDEEVFTQEYKKLKAKRKVSLYYDTTKDEESLSGYHVEEGGVITQLDRSETWARIKLSSGEELFAELKDFTDNTSNSENTIYIDEDESEQELKFRRRINKVRSTIPTEEIELRLSQGDTIGEQVAEFGLQFVGGRYVWGGNSLEHGVDCSGFTREVYKRFGIDLPRYSGDQAYVGRSVSLEEALPGDLVCYDGHVGLYIGNGKMVHASNPRRGIIVTDVYFSGNFHSIRRVVEN